MSQNLREAGFRAMAMSSLMQPLMAFVGNFGYVAVCVAGAALALNGQISFGVIVAFMMYVRYFTQPLSQIAQAAQSMQSAAAAGERVFGFLDAEEMPDERGKTAKLERVRGAVEFDHVRFAYPGSERPVIRNFSAAAKPGQKIAIVGPTGAGKTTLVNLLMRFYELDGGQIHIDGTAAAEMKREDVHALFCMVLQDTWLFEGTVRENLIYCTPGVRDETMRAACKAVGLDHFIRSLPQGYDTVLSDSVNLSQGQKQQLTIARAMIADRPMLILDEATRLRRHAHGIADSARDGRAHARADVVRHRPPAFDDQKRRPDPRDEGRRRDRKRLSRTTAGEGRVLRGSVQQPV